MISKLLQRLPTKAPGVLAFCM